MIIALFSPFLMFSHLHFGEAFEIAGAVVTLEGQFWAYFEVKEQRNNSVVSKMRLELYNRSYKTIFNTCAITYF